MTDHASLIVLISEGNKKYNYAVEEGIIYVSMTIAMLLPLRVKGCFCSGSTHGAEDSIPATWNVIVPAFSRKMAFEV